MRTRGSLVALVLGVLLLAAVAGLGVGGLLGQSGEGGADTAGGSGATAGTGPTPAAGAVTLAADKTAVPANQTLTLTGTVGGAAAGVTVQVQRQEGGEWADFPAKTTTKSGGAFTVDVQIGRSGQNVLRVVADSGAASVPVTVTVG